MGLENVYFVTHFSPPHYNMKIILQYVTKRALQLIELENLPISSRKRLKPQNSILYFYSMGRVNQDFHVALVTT